MACIYLIQPAEYIDTDICKIGCSRNNNLKRVKSYGKGTRYLCVMECREPFNLEKKLLKNLLIPLSEQEVMNISIMKDKNLK